MLQMTWAVMRVVYLHLLTYKLEEAGLRAITVVFLDAAVGLLEEECRESLDLDGERGNDLFFLGFDEDDGDLFTVDVDRGLGREFLHCGENVLTVGTPCSVDEVEFGIGVGTLEAFHIVGLHVESSKGQVEVICEGGNEYGDKDSEGINCGEYGLHFHSILV